MTNEKPNKKKARTLEPVKDPRGWRLSIPASISGTGARRQFFYATSREAADAARAWKERAARYGGAAVSPVSPTEAEALRAALELLEPYGIGLVEAARRVAEVEERARASAVMEDALAAFQDSGSWSASQAAAYKNRCARLLEDFPGRIMSSITQEDITSHIERTCGTPATRNHAARLIRRIWRWSAKPPRGWCSAETVAHIENEATTASEVGILRPAEAVALLRSAETHYPDTVPAFAVAVFTGLRQAEIDRLRGEDFKRDGIEVRAGSSKTKRRRFIKMPAPLAAWLKAYPPGETLTPPDWERKWRAVRRLAGFKVWSNLIDPPTPPETLPEWPSNALRHTAASVAVALGKPLEDLIFEHGHSGGVALLKRHYLGSMSRADAKKIWSIKPKPTAR